jgi:hypothetical protein
VVVLDGGAGGGAGGAGGAGSGCLVWRFCRGKKNLDPPLGTYFNILHFGTHAILSHAVISLSGICAILVR